MNNINDINVTQIHIFNYMKTIIIQNIIKSYKNLKVSKTLLKEFVLSVSEWI